MKNASIECRILLAASGVQLSWPRELERRRDGVGGRRARPCFAWTLDDAREAYLHLLERDERLADEFQRRVTRALAETAHHYQAREGNGSPPTRRVIMQIKVGWSSASALIAADF